MLYLTRRKANYWFRRRLPCSIASKIRRSEIIRSLQTSDAWTARRRARHAGYLIDRLLAAISANKTFMTDTLDSVRFNRLLNRIFELVLNDLANKTAGRIDPSTQETQRERFEPITEAGGPTSDLAYYEIGSSPAEPGALYNEDEYRIEHAIGEYGIFASINDPEPIRAIIEQAIAAENLSISADHPRLARPALNVAIKAAQRLLKEIRGEWDFEPSSYVQQSFAAEPPSYVGQPFAPTQPPLALPEPKKPNLSEFLEPWIEEKRRSVHWGPDTERVTRTSLHVLFTGLGDRPLDGYTREDMEGLQKLMEGIPTNFRKPPRHRTMTLAEVVADNIERRTKVPGFKGATIAKSTLNQHWQRIKAFMTWARTRENSPKPDLSILFDEAKWSATVPEGEPRQAWDDEALQFLFQSPIWTGCVYDPKARHRRWEPGTEVVRDEYFWLPLLALFLSLRMEEAARLKGTDVFDIDGIPVIDITKGLKSPSSKRIVPIHETLIKCGFLDFAARANSDRLFPLTKPSGKSRKYSKDLTKDFTEYRRAFIDADGNFIIYRRLMDFHSFRTTATSKMVSAGVSAELTLLVADEITGHTSKARRDVDAFQTITLDYLAGSSLTKRRDAINSIQFPDVSFDHLFEEKYRTSTGIERGKEIRRRLAQGSGRQSKASFRAESDRE